MITWKLRKSATPRKGHPWIFAKDLEIEAHRASPGDFVRVVNDKNEMVSFGYGNPRCALAFRALPLAGHPDFAKMASVGPASAEFRAWVADRVVAAWKEREAAGFRGSYRIVFSEADDLPGLILDRYELSETDGQVLAAQILTAGFERIWGDGTSLIEMIASKHGSDWDRTILVERKDAGIRKVEGLEVLAPQVRYRGEKMTAWTEEKLKFARVRMKAQGPADEGFVDLTADLIEGQKTGFFLDQSWNMRLVMALLHDRVGARMGPLRVLDLCSYVGHWSLQLGRFAKARGLEFHADLVDVSAAALARAEANLAAADLSRSCYELDVLKDAESWPKGPYDIVIADPPAFVKAKKDLPQGVHAYMKLNAEAARRVRDGGLLVSCSCSGAVDEEDLARAVAQAAARDGRRALILGRGQQGADHPWRPQFPEGRYLKMQITQFGVNS